MKLNSNHLHLDSNLKCKTRDEKKLELMSRNFYEFFLFFELILSMPLLLPASPIGCQAPVKNETNQFKK